MTDLPTSAPDDAGQPSDSGEEAATTATTKKTTAKKTSGKKTTAKKTAKKAAAKKTTAKKAAGKKTTAKKTAKKAGAKKTTTKKAAGKKTARKTAGKPAADPAEETSMPTAAPAADEPVIAEGPDVETDEIAAPQPSADGAEGEAEDLPTPVAETEEDSEGDSETGGGRKRRRRRGGRGRKSKADADGGVEGDAESGDGPDEDGDGNGGEAGTPEAETTEDGKTARKKTKSRRDRRWPDRAAIEVTPSGPKAPKGSRLMLVDEVPGESCRIAILENGRIEELFVERAQSSTAVGNIYKARVVNVESAIQAAFVDYGSGMNGFLHVSDLHPRYFPGGDKTEKVGRKTPRRERPPIQDALKKGQEILVQVLKQGVGTKGPTVTSYLSIPGRLMVMMPGMDRVGVSRKVDDDQRDRMRKILDQLDLPDGFGFILRTAGYDRTKTELKRDVSYLRRLWDQLEKRMAKVGAPSELYTEGDLLVRTLRDVVDDSIGSIVVNSDTGFERARTFLDVIAPKSAPTVRHYDEAVPLFDAFRVESQIDMIHAREVPLRSGGALVIDQTEAMVAIDVNSGRSRGAKDAESNAVSTNREAVDEIARQLRLRDQGGLVVCDLIDMRFARNRKEIEERLANNLGRDRARTTFLPISEFGLVEMTRQRIRPSIRSQYFTPCGHCHGLGEIRNPDSVAADAIRRAARFLSFDQVDRVELVCGSRVASAILAGHRRRIDALERESGGRVDVRISESIPSDRFDAYAYDDRGADLDLSRLPKLKTPDPESLPTEIAESEDHPEGERGSGGGRRRRRRRRKPAPADVVTIALAGGFDDVDEEEDDDEILDGRDPDTGGEATDGEEGEGGRRRRRRRRRRRGRGGAEEATPAPPPEPIRVHELAKALEIKSREILDAVAEKVEGLDLKGAMSWIPAEFVEAVRAIWKPEETTPEAPADSTSASSGEDADAEADVETDGDGVAPTGDGAEDEGDAPKKKRRRRRRRGGRRRRGAGEGEGEGDESESDVSPGDSAREPMDDPEPSDTEESPAGNDGDQSAPVVETAPAAPLPKKRRSLYGGRFQRLSTPPAISEER